MRTRRIGGLLAALVLAGLAPVAAPAQADEPTVMEIEREYSMAIYRDAIGPKVRDRVRFLGRLSSNEVPQPNLTVELQRKLVGQSSYRFIADAVTDSEGIAEFTTPARGNARYRIAFGGAAGSLAASASEPVSLKVMRDFNAAKQTRRGKIWLRGNINPGWGRRTVVFEKKACSSCRWRVVARAKAKPTGGWRFRAGYPPLNRTWRFRARIGKSPTFVASTSAILVTTRRLARGVDGTSALVR
jgi:hypothetical protein